MNQKNIPGWMSIRDLSILENLASLVRPGGTILEVGSFVGRSTYALYNGKPSSVKLSVIDTFEIVKPYIPNTIINNINGDTDMIYKIVELANKTNSWLDSFKYCLGNDIVSDINIYKQRVEEFAVIKHPDMVFIDGDHTAESVLANMQKFLNKDTLIVGDDFSFKYPGVALATANIRQYARRTLIVPENSKIYVLVPVEGNYWNHLFKKIGLTFFDQL